MDNQYVEINNGKVPGWISSTVSLAWIAIGGWLVLNESRDPGSGIGIGSFFCVLSVFGSVGATWGAIYGTGLRIQASFPAVQRITEYMNKKTDVHERQGVQQKRVEIS